MGSPNIDQGLLIIGFLGEALLLTILFAKGEYSKFPIFLVSVCLAFISDPADFWFATHRSAHAYAHAYAVSALLDYTLQLGVLFEIGHSVLFPSRRSINRWVLIVLGLTLICGLCITAFWALRENSANQTFTHFFAQLQTINLVFAFLRLTVFALIAGFSQMLGITWRNHVIRLAGGLAFYSAFAVIVQLTLSNLAKSNPSAYTEYYSLLERTQVIAYLGALSFWVWSFLQKDAPRREFTPQMQRFLVTMSETARRSRLALARDLGHKP